MSETKAARKARYAGYERNRLETKAPPLRVVIAEEDGVILDGVKTRRGISKGGYAAAVLRLALRIEKLGGDSVAILEHGLSERQAAAKGKNQWTGDQP